MGDRQPSTTGVDDQNNPVPPHGQSGRHGTPERTAESHQQSCASAVAAPDLALGKASSVAKPPALKLATVTDQFDGPTSLRHALQHICHAQAASRTPSTRTSSSSLQALSEDAVVDARSHHDLLRQTLVAHTTQPEHVTADVPVYPDQSYAVLQSQVHHIHHPPFPRSRSAYPEATARPPPARDPRTAGNTPSSSPGLFSAHSPRSTPPLVSDDEERIGSPFLHPTHLQPPKETHTAAVDRDSVTGNKLVNQYELLEELGRGEHGKVKLGRHVVTKQQVAIKIVQRYSKRRRLGKLGNPEDKVKKEIAILKKARHPNVVSLLEVIDDPNRQKVYIVLEYVENGEIVWRKKGLKEIIQADKRRLEREKAGEHDTPAFLEECELYVRTAQRMRRQREKARERRQAMAAEAQRHPIPAWSLEHGGESDDELGPALSIARTTSRSMLNQDEYHPSPSHSFVSTSELDRRGVGGVGGPADAAALAAAFEGSMYGAYVDFPPYERRFSTASSSLGFVPSEAEWTSEDDDLSYVPCLTMTEARNAFRDSVLGLEYLHYQGIIHRDIKPANLLVTANHRVKISDFGVSYLGRPIRDDEDEQVGETDATELDDARELSKTVGTPAFYAPELCYTGDDFVKQIGSVPKITGAIDVWSLGVTLYGMIFGRLPFVSDDDYSMFQTIVKQDVFIPRKRLRPVEDDPDTRAATQWPRSIHTDKRADEELAYEEIDDELFDLLKRLLTKDPLKRITLKEIKHHPWVLHGLPNPSMWIEETDPGHQSKGKKIEVSNEEVTTAVSKVPPFIQRVRSNVAKWSGYLTGRTKDKDGRKRATSSVTSFDSCHSSASSKDNVVHHSWDGRRASLRGDEDGVRTTTSKVSSRDGEHPLATSVTASPVERDEGSPKSIRAETNRPPTPVRGRLARPAPPQRAASARSTAESTKTVRPSDFETNTSAQHPRASSPTFAESSTGAFHVGGLFSGASRRLAKGFHIGDYRSERSPSIDTAFLDADRHSEPGVALSAPSSAIGRTPGIGLWREGFTLSATTAAPATVHRRNRSHQASCQSSSESFHATKEALLRPMHPDHGHGPRADGGSLTLRTDGSGVDPAFHDSNDPRQKLLSLPEPSCPPASTIITDSGGGDLRTSPPFAATISSSSADDYTSGMSQCASHPSIPSVVSGASSLSGDGLRVHTKDCDVNLSSVPVVPPLPRMDDNATVRQVVLEDDESRYDCDDEDDSEDEGIIIMGKKKPQQSANRSRQ